MNPISIWTISIGVDRLTPLSNVHPRDVVSSITWTPPLRYVAMYSSSSIWLPLFALYSFWVSLAQAVSGQEPLQAVKADGYKLGQSIPVSCLNRTMWDFPLQLLIFPSRLTLKSDTGEHILDSAGHLQYIPFPVCNETGRPLELFFGVEKGTIETPHTKMIKEYS